MRSFFYDKGSLEAVFFLPKDRKMTGNISNQRSESKKSELKWLKRKKQAAATYRNELLIQQSKPITERRDLTDDKVEYTLDQAQAKKDRDKAKKNGNTSEVDRLNTLIDQLEVQINAKQLEIDAKTAEIDAIQVDIDEQDAIIEDLQQQIDDWAANSVPTSVPTISDPQHVRAPGMPWPSAENSPGGDAPRTPPTMQTDPLDRNIFDRPVSRPETTSLMPSKNPVISSGAYASEPLTNSGDATEPAPDMASAQSYYDQLTSALAPSVDIGTATEPADIAPWPGLEIDQPDADGDDFAFPVVLDLGNDGIQFIPLGQSRARFDIDGDGRRQILAWVGPDDGLLVYDRDGDRVISHKDEIAFKDYLANAKTDLEGLAWFDQFAQGGNEDGVLDARDALWSKFGVWRDADQDGETDPGELRMTGEGGLSSVNLQSDKIRRDAGPDAQIFGRGDFSISDADGKPVSGALYDVALRYVDENTEPFAETTANLLYPPKPPEPKALRRIRKDGQPLSRAEILYPKHGNDDEYYFVEAEPETWIDPAKERAKLLYDHPTSQPKPKLDLGRRVRRDGTPLSRAENLYPDGYPPEDYMYIKIGPHKQWT